MTPKPDQHIDYDALLSRAVGSLDRNAYATRGAVYEREYRALLKRLSSTVPPSTGTDITREERAFRDAIRRIEFPEYDEPAAPISEAGPAPPAEPPPIEEDRRQPASAAPSVAARRRPLSAQNEGR